MLDVQLAQTVRPGVALAAALPAASASTTPSHCPPGPTVTPGPDQPPDHAS